MPEFQKILVGLELDPETHEVTLGSRKAAQQAVWVAKANSGKIHFLHSTYDDESYPDVIGSDPTAPAEPHEAGVASLEELAEDTRKAGVEVQLEIIGERIWMAMIKKVLREEADLVIVAKRNQPPSDGRKVGSTAMKLLRKCPAPVWVVKPDHDLVHRLVLSASDLTPVGDRAVDLGARIARRQGCELHLVHAYQIPFQLQMEFGRLSDVETAARVEELRAVAAAHLRESVREPTIEEEKLSVHVGKGAPASVIREAVAHLDPDLLVMGSVSRGGLAGFLIGSTAERLLDRLDCSILAVKPDDFICPVQLPD